jgi:ankyrin repeat protein
MKDVEDIFFNEEWKKVLEVLIENKTLISKIAPFDSAWKRFQYQLAENGKEELIPPFESFSDLMKIIDSCKTEGLLGLTIPQATALQQLDQIKQLIDDGHKVDEQDFGERTGLLIAGSLNDFNLVKFFIDQGAFVSFYGQDNL